jgi:hypothetical protein
MAKYRSGFEERIAKELDKRAIPYLYEAQSFEYTTRSRYKPDLFLMNGVILELKGFFSPSDRRKHVAMKEQHPELDVRMVFQRNNLLTRKSKSTYGMWCDKYDIPWCVWPDIPTDWLQ